MDYEIINDGEAITCLKCNMTSHHPMDVKYRWCGNCKECLDPVMADECAKIRGTRYRTARVICEMGG
jgi:hypothetical protein